MSAPATRWWNKRIPIRHRRRFLVLAYLILLVTQGMFARKRLLFERDRHYQIAFLCYSLVMAAMFVGLHHFSQPERHMEEPEFAKLQIRAGAFMAAFMIVYWLFSDYSSQSLNASSLVGTFVAGSLIFVITAATTTNPPAASQQPSEERQDAKLT